MTEPNEAVRQALEKEREVSERSRKEAQERLSKGKPTPTQEENDRAKLGEHIMEHEDDGSGEDPGVVMTRQIEARRQSGSSAGYQTRAAEPQPQPQQQRTSRPASPPKSE